MHRTHDSRNELGASRKPFDPPRLTPSTPEGDIDERMPFEPPHLTPHETLPVITAGSPMPSFYD